MSSALPAKPSLEQLKKQAKDVLAAHADRSASCLPVLRHLHQFKDAADQAVFAATLKLADVQFALAMEYGFTTWDELVRHLESRNIGLSEKAARAWDRIRKHGTLAGIIGGEVKSVTEGGWSVFTVLDIEGPNGRFTVDEAEPGEQTARLVKMQRLGEFLKATGVQAPQITLLEAEGRTLGVYKPEMGGTPVGSVELSSAEREHYANDMARLLHRMHSVPLADALRMIGLPSMSPEGAARESRFGGYLEVDVIQNTLAAELQADKALNDVWQQTRAWITTFVSTPQDLVFGHGDMWSDGPHVTKTPEGYRLSGIGGLHNAGLMNIYDEFLRVASLGYFIEDKPVERAVIEAYSRLPGTRRVEELPLRHAITAFWFYLAHETSSENRLKFMHNAKRTQQ